MAEEMARQYFGQMASAMEHCHARSVFHRDLKPENILLGGESLDEIKIADFGLAAMLNSACKGDSGDFLNHTKCGSIMYAAPELLMSNERTGYDAATADIWSLGVILYSMLAGALPFKVALPSRCPRFAWVQQHGLGPICEHLGLSPPASALLQGMLRPVGAERLTLSQILESAWLQPIAHTLPPRAAPSPGTPVRRLSDGLMKEAAPAAPAAPAAAVPAAPLGKWCEEITEYESQGKRPRDGAEEGEGVKRARSDGGEELEGVNGMLVRSLGWVQLPSDKEQMVADVASALDNLGVRYSIERGELCNVVTATVPADEKTGEPMETEGGLTVQSEACGTNGAPPPDVAEFAEGQLTVRFRLHPNGTDASTSDLHIERDAGAVMQFHSFYRDIRNELVGVNGWSRELGRYMREAPPS
eukprot:Transcript_10355.p1 GENE.Transcript_10355~~Transcript_10355.p1  ORF type:complete len:416 (+),score=183.65 Transcript_10355:604-1851(+)